MKKIILIITVLLLLLVIVHGDIANNKKKSLSLLTARENEDFFRMYPSGIFTSAIYFEPETNLYCAKVYEEKGKYIGTLCVSGKIRDIAPDKKIEQNLNRWAKRMVYIAPVLPPKANLTGITISR